MEFRSVKSLSLKALWICFLSLIGLAQSFAATPECSAVFPDGVQTNSNSGTVKFEWASKVTGSPDNILATKRLTDNSGGNSCNTTSCGSTGSAASSMDFNDFPNNNNDVEIGYRETRTLLPGNYDDIRLNSRAVATLTPGDYQLRGSLTLKSDAQINITGSGVVRILLKGNVKFESGSDINVGGDASQLVIFSHGEVSLSSDATVTGFIYAKKMLRLYSRAEVNGAVSGKSVELRSSASKVNYLPSAVSAAAFGDLCGGGAVTPPPPPPAASGCAAIWPDGVQSHSSSGEVKFEWGTKVINSPDNIIDAVEIDDDSGGVSCGNTTCTASFNPSTAMDFNGFKSSGGSDFKVDYKQSRTISPGTYKKIELKGQATLTMEAGDYYVTDDVKMKWDSSIVLPSSGVVRMFVRKKFESEGRGEINSNGNANQLLIVAKEDVKFKNTDDVKALIYSQKKVEVGHGSDVTGAISAKEVKLKSSSSTVTYDASAVTSAQLGEICSGGPAESPEPIAEYRFDECTVESVLADQQDTYSATANEVSTVDDARVGKALDLSATGTDDWVDLPRSLINGLDDLSVSLWIKTSTSKSQQEILQALGSNTDDDELEIYLVNSSRVRLQIKDDDVYLDSGVTLTNGAWHHLVVTRQDDRGCLYVDGSLQECDTGLGTGALSVPRDAVVIGQEQDSYGGSFSSSQSFEGLMDEFKVYNRALSSSDANSIYTNELAGNNADGSTREPLDCQITFEPLAELRFDEIRWSGVANEVKDSSGNNNHGSLVGWVDEVDVTSPVRNIAEGKICRAGSIGSNSDADDIYAIDSEIDLNGVGDAHTVSFWYRPSNAWNDGNTRVLMDASGTTGSKIYYYLAKESDGRLEFGLENTSDGDFSQKSSTSYNFTSDTWVHLAVTVDADSGKMKAYVNGSKALERDFSGTLGDVFSLYFGDNRSSYTAGPGTGRSAHGDFDEVLVFEGALSSDHIATIYNFQNEGKNLDGSLRECADLSPVDHYGISAPATALTCEAAQVEITAYDVDGNPVAPLADTVITLTTDPAVDGWSITPASNSFVAPNTYTFDGEETSVISNLINTDPEIIDIDVMDGDDISAPEAEGIIEFKDVAFSFSTIAAQISGKDSDSVTLSARQTDGETGACVALNPGSTVDVGIAYSCETPGTCTTAQDGLTIDGTSLDSLAEGYTAVSLEFDSNGDSTFKFAYLDAGKIKLHAQAELTIDETVEGTDTVSGSSNAFVVSPAGLCVEALDPSDVPFVCSTGDASCDPYAAAGADFKLKVSARRWQTGESTPANYCDNDGPTPNFELSGISLSPNLIAPVGGQNGELGVNSLNIESGGEVTINNQTIDEVGVFSITAVESPYMGQTIPSSTSAAIGRFYPDHFAVGAGGVGVTDRYNFSCSPASDFTYMGEEFETNFELLAQNVANEVTLNYVGDFANLNDVEQLDLKLINKPDGGTVNLLSGRAPDTTVTAEKDAISDSFIWFEGSGSITLELLLKRLSTEDGPYTDLTLAVAPNDGDATLNSFDVDTSGDGDSDHAVVGDKTEVRYGRMQIQNTYGPETSALNQPVFIQYYDGTGFVTNTDDSCTSLATGNITLQADGESALVKGVVSNVSIGSGTTDLAIESNVEAGEANLTYTATGAGNTGAVTITYDVPEWLQFNWGGSNDPSATATFGRFRGSDRVIYWLEQ